MLKPLKDQLTRIQIFLWRLLTSRSHGKVVNPLVSEYNNSSCQWDSKFLLLTFSPQFEHVSSSTLNDSKIRVPTNVCLWHSRKSSAKFFLLIKPQSWKCFRTSVLISYCCCSNWPQIYFRHGILQARILEQVAFHFSRGFSSPGIESTSPALQADSSPAELKGSPKNTGVGGLSLLQWFFPTQEWKWGLLHCRWIVYQLSYQWITSNLHGVCFFLQKESISTEFQRSEYKFIYIYL